ncbi:LPS export ABC transporter permease LptG [Planktotalea sp.]|uniref:LPS export ABC transporter permease LptG n=1 Tax=Planktotalea sp. TaxID=2029877 RepID=UPI0025EB6C21|nr:LPS export ABC transporter permease LptG [Planktotalea sp.]
MILHLYFARRFFRVFLATLLIFIAFLTLIDLIEQMRRFSNEGVGFSDILVLTLLNAPGAIYQILPLIMILSSVSLFLTLARTSELVVTRSAGRSALVALISPMVVSALIGIGAVTLFNPIVAATSQRYLTLEREYKKQDQSTFSIGRDGLWLRQGDEDGQTVIHANAATEQMTTLFDVSFLQFNSSGQPHTHISAEQANLTANGWQLISAKLWPLDTDENPEENARELDQLSIPTTLTIERIRDSFSEPSATSIWDLGAYINELKDAGFSARRHEVWRQMELARPLFLMAMVLVGAGFTMRHSRFGKTGIAVLAAVMLGFGLFYVRNFAQILGENGQLPTVIAAWTPPIASILLALGLLLHMEDG